MSWGCLATALVMVIHSGFLVLKFVGVEQSKAMHGFSPNFQDSLTYFWVLKSVVVPQHKPVHGFSPNFQEMFTPRISRAD